MRYNSPKYAIMMLLWGIISHLFTFISPNGMIKGLQKSSQRSGVPQKLTVRFGHKAVLLRKPKSRIFRCFFRSCRDQSGERTDVRVAIERICVHVLRLGSMVIKLSVWPHKPGNPCMRYNIQYLNCLYYQSFTVLATT